MCKTCHSAAQACLPPDLLTLADRAGIPASHLVPYGRDVAKVDLTTLQADPQRGGQPGSPEQAAHYVVVSAITPTPLGEGKTATAIGLAQGLRRAGHRSVLTLRQSAMGPTFGIKGGAAGSGQAQVLPAERMNLHLTGDFHAVTAAHNLLAALIDNHLHHGNALRIQERSITWPRVLDVNDRALRHVVTGLGAPTDGVTRQASFDITPASEVMAILSLATDLADLRRRLGQIVVARNRDGAPVTAEHLQAAGAMAALLRDALSPNLLRTSEGAPVLVHTGPFGNIATGCSSVVADQVAAAGMAGRGQQEPGFVVTEAGFGADLGLERLVDLKCAVSGLTPAVVVLVATVRALKVHSGRYRVVPGQGLPEQLLQESPQDVRAGAANLLKHVEVVRGFGLEPVVAVNAFPTDRDSELQTLLDLARQAGVRAAVSRPVSAGGAGCLELAALVARSCQERRAVTGRTTLVPLYAPQDMLRDKVGKVAAMYGADGVSWAPAAARQVEAWQAEGWGSLPVLVARTPLSLTADPQAKGAPTGWQLPVREVRLAAGAGYVYALCGSVSTMPGLPSHPAAHDIDVDPATGQVLNLR